MNRIMFLIAVVALSGCSVLQETTDKAAQKIGKGVGYYCINTIPEIRQEFRAAVNKYAAPNEVSVTCANDGATLSTE